jgi:hypothetical protein
MTPLPVVGTEDKNITCCGANNLNYRNASSAHGPHIFTPKKVFQADKLRTDAE